MDSKRTTAYQNILGVILAGGQSRRMGDVDKTFMPLGQQPLIDHTVKRLSPQVEKMLIISNGPHKNFNHLGIEILSDCVPAYNGPLGGILTALRFTAQSGQFDAIVSIAVDTPFFPFDFVQTIKTYSHFDIVLASSHGRLYPTCGLWSAKLVPHLQTFFDHTQTRKVMDFICTRCWTHHKFEDTQRRDPFFNINTPADLATAQSWIT